MKSNAARHLIMITSILLFFFVYMGYRIWGQPETHAYDEEAASVDISSLNPGTSRAASNLMTVNDTPPTTATTTVSAPISTPSGMPPALGGGNEMADLTPPPRRGSELSLKPPGAASGGSPAVPSGSLEESNAPRGAITGLVPGPRLSPPGESASGSGAQASGRADAGGAAATLQPPGGNALKPPGSAAPGGALLVPPPGGAQRSTSSGGSSSAPVAASGASGGNALPAPTSSGGTGLTPPARTPATGSGVVAPVPPASGVSTSSPASTPRPTPVTSAPGTGRAAGAASESLRVYIIRSGDTLSRIAARELGSSSLADNIFLLNRDVIADPDHLVVGDRIMLPVREAPVATPRSGAVSPVAPVNGRGDQAGGPARMHRVARGDTLSSIALKYYGSSAAWRFLYESNADVVANPNQLSVGTELVIPPYGERRQ